MKKMLCIISILFMMATAGCATQTPKSKINTANTAAAASAGDNAAASSAKQTSSPELPSKNEQSDSFVKIDMLTINSGYAITKDFHVLKTSDAGGDWTDLLTLGSVAGEPALFAFDENTLYAAAYTSAGIEVEKSADAGKSWLKSEIKMTDDFNTGYGGSLELSFFNKSEGYLLTSGSPAAGLMSRALYRTSDGGNNWSLVGRGGGVIEGIDGYTTGITFLSANTGYVTCTYHGQTEISVYKTVDGGKNWSVASLPLPQKYISLAYGNDYYVDAYPPVFYGEGNKNAKMELYFCHEDERYTYIYSSDDAGDTWHIDGTSNLKMTEYSFADNKKGFGLDENGKLYTTNDGGITWSGIS